MHLLLIAYDFPPIPSPQSLRWAYLAGEIARAGHRVEVIAPDVAGYGPGGLPELPAGVVVHRVAPGWRARLFLGRRQAHAPAGVAAVADGAGPAAAGPVDAGPANPGSADLRLNWKGRLRGRIERAAGASARRLLECIKAVVSWGMFPDYRAGWVPHAVAKMDEIVARKRPDVVVVSHEPACSLPVGLAAVRRGLTLAADMGDPVLAAYTPAKWRSRALQLERDICRTAALVSVTTAAAADLLLQRHAMPGERLMVLHQGFDPRFVAEGIDLDFDFDPDRLELLYTGSFYSFRRAEALLQAVLSVADVRLTIATINAPGYLVGAAAQAPQSIRIVGFMPHRDALAAQRACDVLVNLANDDPVQIPGKLFEYLGAGRPVLHLRGDQQDAAGAAVRRFQAGWELASRIDGIVDFLRSAKELKAQGRLRDFAAGAGQVDDYSWPRLAAAWLSRLASRQQASPPPVGPVSVPDRRIAEIV